MNFIHFDVFRSSPISAFLTLFHAHTHTHFLKASQVKFVSPKCLSVSIHPLEPGWLTKSHTFKQDRGPSPSQRPSVSNTYLGRVGVSYSLSHIGAGISSGLSLHNTCACSHHCCEFILVTLRLAGIRVTIDRTLTVFLPPVLHWSLSLGRQNFDVGVLLRNKHAPASYFLHVAQLLISLVRVERCSDLQV